MTPEEKEQGWRYVLVCMQKAAEYAKRAADMAEKIKGDKPKLELVKDDD